MSDTSPSEGPECRMCLRRHGERYMCDPAREFVLASYARGDANTMPTVAFSAPVEAELGPGAQLLSQFVVKAAVLPVAGVPRAGLVITGRDHLDQPLPSWLYVGDDKQIRAGARLAADMADLAIRNAQKARGNR